MEDVGGKLEVEGSEAKLIKQNTRIDIPYILKSNPHPNLIRTQVFGDFLNEKS
jgi:hypothetical protein